MELKKHLSFFLTFALAIAFAILTYKLYKYQIWDSTAYLSNANYFLTGNGYFEILRAPLLPIMLTGFISFGLENFVPPIFIFLFLLSTYFLGSELFGKKTGFFAALIAAAVQIFTIWSPRILSDVPAATFATIALIFVNRAIKDTKNLYIFGFFASLAFLTRYPAGIILPIGLLYYFSRKKSVIFKEKETYLSAVAFAALPAIWFLWTWKNFGSPFVSMQQGITTIATLASKEPITFYAATFHSTFGLLAFPAILALLAGFLALKKDNNLWLIYMWIFFTYIALSIISHKEERYAMLIVPAVSILIASMAFKSKFKKALVVVLIIFVALSFNAGYREIQKIKTGDVCNENIIAAAKYVSGAGNVISSYYPIISYYGNVTGVAFQSDKSWLSGLIKLKNITYVLASDNGDAPEWAKDKSYFEKQNYLAFEKEFKGPCQTIWAFRVIPAS